MEPLVADDPPAIGGFRLNARLGFGGMGRMYLGFSPAGRAVAVKVVRPELAMDAGFRHRFHTEVEAARRVSGAYTAPVIAACLLPRSPGSTPGRKSRQRPLTRVGDSRTRAPSA